ncbi:MAG: tRNA (adenosine(37)-N6)-threonylcarbamoyltransferase complex dimerization subunit type 1 TsaB [Hyphomicrobiales bacterium]|nr:tRNA (adenosine(37)-N6)-threonylcarbamoyltransferase complex dimerization subunit type 1 TsaB [Hyphomicrobiales bacterium]MCP4999156.1 tRNA (adenosine(37)-N6)-threonylcarbamoyltransferase complex dimerization subunit type 1 TsaB [Hyphomicrobiales bacterium]
MITLAIDTAAHLCAACVYDSVEDKVLGKAVEDLGRGHAERLFAVIRQALDEAAMDYSDLQRLGVCIGPGSFTGVRVGVAAMRGLSLALSVPLVGVTIFDGLAQAAPKGRPLFVLLDARRGEVYVQLFDQDGNADGSPAAMSLEAAGERVRQSQAALTGSGASLVFDADDKAGRLIVDYASTADIETIARLGAQGRPQESQPEPLYLRSADAKPQSGFAVERQGAKL